MTLIKVIPNQFFSEIETIFSFLIQKFEIDFINYLDDEDNSIQTLKNDLALSNWLIISNSSMEVKIPEIWDFSLELIHKIFPFQDDELNDDMIHLMISIINGDSSLNYSMNLISNLISSLQSEDNNYLEDFPLYSNVFLSFISVNYQHILSINYSNISSDSNDLYSNLMLFGINCLNIIFRFLTNSQLLSNDNYILDVSDIMAWLVTSFKSLDIQPVIDFALSYIETENPQILLKVLLIISSAILNYDYPIDQNIVNKFGLLFMNLQNSDILPSLDIHLSEISCFKLVLLKLQHSFLDIGFINPFLELLKSDPITSAVIPNAYNLISPYEKS